MQVIIQDISANRTVRKGHFCETNNEATLEKEKLLRTQNEKNQFMKTEIISIFYYKQC